MSSTCGLCVGQQRNAWARWKTRCDSGVPTYSCKTLCCRGIFSVALDQSARKLAINKQILRGNVQELPRTSSIKPWMRFNSLLNDCKQVKNRGKTVWKHGKKLIEIENNMLFEYSDRLEQPDLHVKAYHYCFQPLFCKSVSLVQQERAAIQQEWLQKFWRNGTRHDSIPFHVCLRFFGGSILSRNISDAELPKWEMQQHIHIHSCPSLRCTFLPMRLLCALQEAELPKQEMHRHIHIHSSPSLCYRFLPASLVRALKDAELPKKGKHRHIQIQSCLSLHLYIIQYIHFLQWRCCVHQKCRITRARIKVTFLVTFDYIFCAAVETLWPSIETLVSLRPI